MAEKFIGNRQGCLMGGEDRRVAQGEETSSWKWIQDELKAIQDFLREHENRGGDYFGPSAEGVVLFRGLLPSDGDAEENKSRLSPEEKEELRNTLRQTVRDFSDAASKKADLDSPAASIPDSE